MALELALRVVRNRRFKSNLMGDANLFVPLVELHFDSDVNLALDAQPRRPDVLLDVSDGIDGSRPRLGSSGRISLVAS